VTGPGRSIWFLDTASLLSMAVDVDIAAAVLAEIGSDVVVIIDVVHEELRHRASISSTAALAQTAMAGIQPHWTLMNTERLVLLEDVQRAQEDVADGRTLIDDEQHWAESTIIALGRRSSASSTSIKLLLSEDFDARRVASRVPNMRGLSVHALLHQRVHAQKMTAEAAAALATELHGAGRGPEVTAADFTDPTGRALGRVVRP
jgi:hypothetical protein